MTTRKLTKDAAKFLQHRGHPFVLTNVYVFGEEWECDVFGLDRADLATEIEVKVSKNDFLADFSKTFKHHQTGSGSGAAEFWYAVPQEMASYAAERAPDYAGILTYPRYNNNALIVHRKADRLHNDPIDDKLWKPLAMKVVNRLAL